MAGGYGLVCSFWALAAWRRSGRACLAWGAGAGSNVGRLLRVRFGSGDPATVGRGCAASPGAGRLGRSILEPVAWAGSMRPGRFGSGRPGLDRSSGLGWASGVAAEIVKCLTRTEEARWASAFDRVGGWRGGGRCTGSRWGIPCKAFSQITPLTTPLNKKPSPRPTRCVTIKPDRG